MLFHSLYAKCIALQEDIPRVITNNNGMILRSNGIFKRNITSAVSRIKNLISLKTYGDTILGVTHDDIWHIESQRIFNVFQLSFLHIMSTDAWSDHPFPMAWIDHELCILACNKRFIDEFDGRVNDSIRKYLIGLTKSMLKDDVLQIKSDAEYYRVFVQRRDSVFVLTIENITELHDLQNKIANDKQLVTIGHATSSVIHDFRNILTVMSGYCELGMEGGYILALSKIADACKSAHNLVDDLLLLIKNRNQYAKMCNVALLFEKIQDSLKQLTHNIIEFQLPHYQDIAYTPISETVLERIITNIVINAYDAVYKVQAPSIILKLEKIFFKRTWTHLGCELIRGWYICIACIDNGVGIEPELVDAIFQPLNTTKANGNGLGLSSALSALKEIGGGIQVLSRPGVRTRFEIYLPIIQQVKIKEERLSENIAEKEIISKQFVSKKILIVEDNEDVLKLCVMILSKEGYEVFEACNAEDAMMLYDKNHPIDLVITDLNMPGMDGLSMVNKMQEIASFKNMLIISGYDRELLEEKNLHFPTDAHFMLKPIKLLDLKTKVHNIFNNE